ncbi:dynamin family protein [Fischerella thermalis CCMEE 5330]|uniref:Dynamin family protein n=1 Tax=Fischerella thermalis CCMEE 5330 TaxID=2019670 RepID=A0A2N6LYK9_9CYAN|nr:dynamin family protein [Fischerella thermalis]PMB39612.1 dynamin family protein [Fischerella thermalis CCMEE 5330]
MESFAKSLSYDFTYLRQEFLAILTNFTEELRLEKFQNALGKRLIKQIQSQINQILTRLDADFVLVVIGDFKRGKSTFINALLGEAIVTTDVLPETVTINHIQYGSEHKFYICLTDGGQIQLTKEELKSEQLNQILAQLPQPISHLTIETPNQWLRGLRLVDTPGTGDIFKRFDRQVHTYLLQADAVVFVSSALAPFAESEQAFLQMSVIPQDFPKVFFILNRMDDIRTDPEAARLLNGTYKKISNLFPNPQLFGISALDEFCRIQSLSRPNHACAATLETAFQEFRQCLEQTIRLQRDLIQLDRATDHTDQMLQEMEDSLLLLRNAMQADRERLSRVISQCEDPTSELFGKVAQHIKLMKNEINQLSDQACQWMNEFLNRIDNEAIASIHKFKIEDIKRHFQFFLTNSLREAIDKCLAVHKPTIFASYQKAQKAIFAEFKNLTNVSSIEDTVEQKTGANHEYSGTNTGTFQILSDCDTSTFIADLIIRQIQDLKTARQNVNYQQKLQMVLPDFKLAIIKEIRLLYENIATKIEQQIENAYSQDIETSLSVMQQAQEVCAQEAQTVTATNEALQEALSILHHARQQLKVLKQKLCSEDMLETVSQ